MTTYATRGDAMQREIIEPLGEWAEEHDVEAIADEVLYWHDEVREDGKIWLPGCGYRVREMGTDAFWEIVARHALPTN